MPLPSRRPGDRLAKLTSFVTHNDEHAETDAENFRAECRNPTAVPRVSANVRRHSETRRHVHRQRFAVVFAGRIPSVSRVQLRDRTESAGAPSFTVDLTASEIERLEIVYSAVEELTEHSIDYLLHKFTADKLAGNVDEILVVIRLLQQHLGRLVLLANVTALVVVVVVFYLPLLLLLWHSGGDMRHETSLRDFWRC